MQSSIYKLAELIILFIVFPITFAIDFPFWIKFILGILGFIYVVYILFNVEKNGFKLSSTINWSRFWKAVSLKLLFIAFITYLYVWYTDKSQLFIVVKTKPLFWVVILFLYSFFSVYPQELIYRTFFFQRYQSFVNNEKLFVFINAIIFALGHLFFKNTLVIVLTFLGGLLFAITFNKTRSTLLVFIEHAIYGCWLFTIGMGSMLGFPN